MTKAHEQTTPFWAETASLPNFPSLKTDLETDVVVIGGGITGITAAYLLKAQGKRVVLLDRERCASVDTGHTTAHLTCVTDIDLSELARNFGKDHAQAVWDAGLAAIDQIDSIIVSQGIECEWAWVPGYKYAQLAGNIENERTSLKAETQLATELGFDAEYLDAVPFMDRPGICFDTQAKFHPVKYLAGLLSTLSGDGSAVFEKTAVEEVTDDPLSVKAGGHTIRCRDVVIATHTPLMGKASMFSSLVLQSKLYLYTSYVIGARLRKGLVPEALFWDTADPYYYLRIDGHDDHDYAIFGGEDHKTGQSADTEACFTQLETALRRVIPDFTVEHRWSGQVVETNDGLPYIGETSPHQFAATGFSGNGMTFGTLAAMMMTDAVLGRANPWKDLFDVGRTKVKGGLWDYLKENADYPYLIRDRFAGAEGKSLRSVKRGQGRILELKGEAVAASRDMSGKVTKVSPVCTHLGCNVDWNEAERTWDCPCHGSRFKPTGEVIAGPAESPLEKV